MESHAHPSCCGLLSVPHTVLGVLSCCHAPQILPFRCWGGGELVSIAFFWQVRMSRLALIDSYHQQVMMVYLVAVEI